MNHAKTILLSITALTLSGGLSFGQHGRAEQREERHGARARIEERAERRMERRWDRRHERRDFARRLGFSDAQREFARQQVREIGPRAAHLRAEGRAILERARERVRSGDREGARREAYEALRELRGRVTAEFAPRGRALVDALTPEQRARIEARLAERGRTFDPDKASQRLGRALARRAARVHGRDAGPRTGGR